jgi:hypothetical protein
METFMRKITERHLIPVHAFEQNCDMAFPRPLHRTRPPPAAASHQFGLCLQSDNLLHLV